MIFLKMVTKVIWLLTTMLMRRRRSKTLMRMRMKRRIRGEI